MGHAGVTLLLWGPPPPSQQEPSNNDKALAAQEAATAYEKTFQEIVQIPSALGSSQHALVLHSWGCFLVRWLAAVKASQGGAKGVQGGQGRLGGEPNNSVCCKVLHCISNWLGCINMLAAAADTMFQAILCVGPHLACSELEIVPPPTVSTNYSRTAVRIKLMM